MKEEKLEIRKIESYEFEKYKNINLNSLAVYVISLLQEKNIPTTFEIIAVTLFKMFPEKFSLLGFKEYPDATRINRALLQLRPKYRNWAQGDIQLGFTLNEEGKKEAKKVKTLLEKPYLQREIIVKSKNRTLVPDAEVRNLERSKLFKYFSEGKEDELDDRDVYTFLKAYSYTPSNMLQNYINKLRGHAEFNKRKDILMFLKWLEQKYSHIFRKK